MSNEELVRAFTEGRLSRRAFVRQLVEDGMSMPAALGYADTLVPPAAAPNAIQANAESPGTAARSETSHRVRRELPAKPVKVIDMELNFVGDGYIVYQPASDRMHSLNHTAALVLELCTGQHDASEIARLLQRGYRMPAPRDRLIRRGQRSVHMPLVTYGHRTELTTSRDYMSERFVLGRAMADLSTMVPRDCRRVAATWRGLPGASPDAAAAFERVRTSVLGGVLARWAGAAYEQLQRRYHEVERNARHG